MNVSRQISPRVSIIVPCRNEGEFIGRCIASILASDYPREQLEVLVVDGMSADATRHVVRQYAQAHGNITLLDNPRQIIPAGMNIGIRHARGDVVMKMDAHSTYPRTYIANCVKFMHDYDADNVGGVVRVAATRDTLTARCIAAALSHPFGTLNSHFRLGTREPRWVDTVAFGCYRREVFGRIGLYNENLVRSSDMDLNTRLRRAGGKILLIPEAIVYFPKTDPWGFWGHNLVDGFWALYPLRFGSAVFSWRHLVPLALLAVFAGSVAASLFSPRLAVLPGSMLAIYLLGSLASALQVAVRARDWRYLLAMPLVFAARHLSYAMGSLAGLATVLISGAFWRQRFGGHRSRSSGAVAGEGFTTSVPGWEKREDRQC